MWVWLWMLCLFVSDGVSAPGGGQAPNAVPSLDMCYATAVRASGMGVERQVDLPFLWLL